MVQAESGTVVRFHYRRDVTSRPGPIIPLATGPDGEPATGWDWVQSPDKSRVAFTSRDPGLLALGEASGLFVHDLVTGAVAKVADDAVSGLAWSPDSRRIAFVSDAALVPADGNRKSDVYVKDLTTGDVVMASEHTDGTGFHAGTAVAWQDDDHLVLFGCDTARQYLSQFCAIRLRALSTGETREIVPAGSHIAKWRLAPDGRRLLFESASDPLDRGIDRPALYVTDPATAATTVLSTSGKGHPANRAAWGAVWSPDARKVAFRSTADNLVAGDTNGRKNPSRGTDVFVKDLNTGKVTLVSSTSTGKQMTGEPPRDEPAVQWAPKGRKVAFRFATASSKGDRRSTDSTVFIKHLSSGKLEPLIPRKSTVPQTPVVEGYTFSPSGNRIAFLFGARKGCRTDLVPFANLNCYNVLVRDVGTDRLANVSTLVTGLGWRGGPQDGRMGAWSPVWLRDDQLLFLAPDRAPRSRKSVAFPMIKTVKWPPVPVKSPAPWVPAWCDPNRYWWSC